MTAYTVSLADLVSSSDIARIVVLTQAAYNALSPPSASTLYIVTG